jgi:hypothetical protein
MPKVYFTANATFLLRINVHKRAVIELVTLNYYRSSHEAGICAPNPSLSL